MCLMEKLTFQEEEIMLIIWQVKEGVIKDFLNCMEEPRPPYTTVASIVKNLEKKRIICRPNVMGTPMFIRLRSMKGIQNEISFRRRTRIISRIHIKRW